MGKMLEKGVVAFDSKGLNSIAIYSGVSSGGNLGPDFEYHAE